MAPDAHDNAANGLHSPSSPPSVSTHHSSASSHHHTHATPRSTAVHYARDTAANVDGDVPLSKVHIHLPQRVRRGVHDSLQVEPRVKIGMLLGLRRSARLSDGRRDGDLPRSIGACDGHGNPVSGSSDQSCDQSWYLIWVCSGARSLRIGESDGYGNEEGGGYVSHFLKLLGVLPSRE